MKKIYLAFMCLALIPFSVNAASIEDILGRWEGEEKIAGLEYITISQDSFREGRQAVNPCTIKQDGELFIITIKEDFWGEENITTYKAYKKMTNSFLNTPILKVSKPKHLTSAHLKARIINRLEIQL
ncbi:hypothetical protein QUW15_14085 [Desulfovibrio piger]|nr:hypothetical protein [Desulfovibrio piger]